MSILTQTAKNDVSNAAHSFDDTASEVKRTVRDVAEDTGSKVRQFIDRNTEKASEMHHNAEKKINENPMKSVAIAAFAGLVLGALIRR
jgi:ElaB/YqjD/DUF883 family membrane-anchored ribosome-binding protein